MVDDLNHGNIENVLGMTGSSRRADVLIDGVDNFETRFLVNDCAVKHAVPYVYGGAVGTVGMTYTILPHSRTGDTPWEQAGRATPCLRCIFEQAPPPGMNPTCDTAGVLAAIVSIIASYEAAEALKILTANWDAVDGTMRHLDVWENSFHQFKVGQAYDAGNCICCKQHRFEFLEGQSVSGTTTLCGRDAVQLTRHGAGTRLDLDRIAERLRLHGPVRVNKFMLRASLVDNAQPYELTLFTDGRAIVKGTKQAKKAKSIYAKYVGS